MHTCIERWNLVFNLLLWAVVPLPIWLPYVFPEVAIYVVPGIQAAFFVFWTFVALCAIRSTVVMNSSKTTDFAKKIAKLNKSKKKKGEETGNDGIRHLVVISCYKEPVDLIAKTLTTIADQTLASQTTMAVSFEERTPDLRNKQGQLCDLFGQRFREIIFTIHPYGVEGEIPGKCSNANCGIRTSLAHMKRSSPEEFDPDRIIVTTCDADSKFHPRYLEALEYKYRSEKPSVAARGCVFQAPLLYNWNLDASSVVTRVTGLFRAFLMMGALIPFSINTMSVFSFSASLCIAGDFIHPSYQMDDIIALIR